MKMQFQCPNCQNEIKEKELENKHSLTCSSCQKKFPLNHFPNANPKELRQCPLCETKDLYLQKKFPKKLGLGIVIVAAIITLFWDHKYYFTLIATAILDFILYQKCPTVSCCYLCQGEYSDFIQLEDRTAFDLNLHERYRRQSWEG